MVPSEVVFPVRGFTPPYQVVFLPLVFPMETEPAYDPFGLTRWRLTFPLALTFLGNVMVALPPDTVARALAPVLYTASSWVPAAAPLIFAVSLVMNSSATARCT